MNSDQARNLARLHLYVAHALYRSREQSGLSVETVANRAGVSPERIIMIEEGDTTSLTEIAQLCEAMGIDIASVFPESTSQRQGQQTEVLDVPRALRAG